MTSRTRPRTPGFAEQAAGFDHGMAPAAQEAAVKQTTIKRTGNGAYIPVTRDELRRMGADIGTEIAVTVEGGRMTVTKADSAYERTRASAERMSRRYALTLRLFGQ